MELGDAEQDLLRPLRPAKGTKLILAAVIGPIAIRVTTVATRRPPAG